MSLWLIWLNLCKKLELLEELASFLRSVLRCLPFNEMLSSASCGGRFFGSMSLLYKEVLNTVPSLCNPLILTKADELECSDLFGSKDDLAIA